MDFNTAEKEYPGAFVILDPKNKFCPNEHEFTIKDSGERQQFTSGMQRDTAKDKSDPSLIYDGPMFERWIEHLRKGAIKYEKRNWMKAGGQPELDRFRESAFRHFIQWWRGDRDEDHSAAVFFNINGAEYVMERLNVHPTNSKKIS